MVSLAKPILKLVVLLSFTPALCNAQWQVNTMGKAFQVQPVGGDSFYIYVQYQTMPRVTLACMAESEAQDTDVTPQSFYLCSDSLSDSEDKPKPVDRHYLYNLVFWVDGLEFGCVTSGLGPLSCQTRSNANDNWSTLDIVSE